MIKLQQYLLVLICLIVFLRSLLIITKGPFHFSCWACEAWSLVSLFSDEEIEIFEILGQPEYAGIAAAFAFALCSLNWPKIKALYSWAIAKLPSRKFAALREDINVVRRLIKRTYFYMDSDHLTWCEPLRFKLKKIQIELPKDEKEWRDVLPMLLAYSKDGRVADARRYTAKWKE